MSIVVQCWCGKRIRASEDQIGWRTLCPKCGRALTIMEGDQSLAEPVVVETAPVDHSPVVCTSCRATLKPGAVLCTNCGRVLDSGQKLSTRKERLGRVTGRREMLITIYGFAFSPLSLVFLLISVGYLSIAVYSAFSSHSAAHSDVSHQSQIAENDILAIVNESLIPQGINDFSFRKVQFRNLSLLGGELPATVEFTTSVGDGLNVLSTGLVGKAEGLYHTKTRTVTAHVNIRSAGQLREYRIDRATAASVARGGK